MTGSSPPVTAPLRCALVGLGYWGPNLLRVLADRTDVEVTWICDLDEDRLRRAAARYTAAATTTDVDDALRDPDVDAVFLATPVFTHFDLASRALRAGKHVFVEKPLAPSTEKADALIELAQRGARTLMCGHTFLYSPSVRLVKRLIDDGSLGTIYFFSSSRVNLGLHQRDVSVIWDLGPHDFSILLWWLGELPLVVRAVGRDSVVPGIADVAFVSLVFASRIVASVELSWLAPSKLRRTVVVGSDKMAVYEDGAGEPVRVFDHGVIYRDPETFGEYQLSYRTGDIVSPKVETYEPLAREIEEFVLATRDPGRGMRALQLARDVVRVTEAADRSLALGGVEVPLESVTGPPHVRPPRTRRFLAPTGRAAS